MYPLEIRPGLGRAFSLPFQILQERVLTEIYLSLKETELPYLKQMLVGNEQGDGHSAPDNLSVTRLMEALPPATKVFKVLYPGQQQEKGRNEGLNLDWVYTTSPCLMPECSHTPLMVAKKTG